MKASELHVHCTKSKQISTALIALELQFNPSKSQPTLL